MDDFAIKAVLVAVLGIVVVLIDAYGLPKKQLTAYKKCSIIDTQQAIMLVS